jgi:hypothetical protein|tara:strand:- start:2775 stop:3059 length:285 start_codon:yes stop_codon:yes gene_type:complete
MKVETVKGELIVNDIKYRKQLTLKGHFAEVYKGGVDNVDLEDFYDLLGHCAEIAFSDPADILKEYSGDEEIGLLSDILFKYVGLDPQSKKKKSN